MSGFKFRLQQVLELREMEEKQIAAKLAEAESAADEARVAQRALETIQQSGASALRTAHAADSTIGQLKTISYVIEQMNHHIVNAQTKVEQAEEVVTRARTNLTSALQARRVLSRLRERHFESWRTEDIAQEMRTMDELALTRYARRDDGSGTSSPNGSSNGNGATSA